jgi:hypothetical protein
MVLGLCVYDAAGLIVALIATLSGVLNSLGWLIVLLYLFFAAGFGYFLLPGKAPSD